MNIAGRRLHTVLGMVPFSLFDFREKIDHSARAHYIQANENETGYDRLYNMFCIDEFGNQSPELNFVMQGTFTGLIAGAIWGGMIKGKMAYMNFVEKNDATKFTNTFEAKRKLQDVVTLNFAKGAFRWGWRLGLFTGSYVFITTTIAVYRGKSSLLEYATAGFVTGAFYKFSMGPKGMLVGGVVGVVLGGVGGILSLALLRLSGMTMEEIRYWQYNWKKTRDSHIQSTFKKSRAPDTELEQAHNLKVKDNTELIPDIEPER